MTSLYQPIEEAFSAFFSEPQKDCRRVFHGRGHMFEGLEHINVDWYAPVLLISAYEALQSPQDLIDCALEKDAHQQIKHIVLQQRASTGATSETVYGDPVKVVVCEENGLKYEVQPGVRQNAGLFLDMRPLRSWLRENSEGKNFLNLFSYTCSLSVAALAGGARQVVSCDMSKPSIQWGQRNHQLNDQDMRSVRSIPHNLFRSWGRVQQFGRYDLIVIDPPTRQRGSFDAEKDYAAVLKRLHRLVNPGTDIIATINSPYLDKDYLPNLMARHQPEVRLLGEMPASPEFVDKYPERALKIYHFRAPG